MVTKEGNRAGLAWPQTFLRRAVSRSLEPIWPHTTEHQGNGLVRAQELLAEGCGIVVLINHFSLRDAQEVLKDIIFSQPVFRERFMTAPIAAHQSNVFLGLAASAFGVNVYPVVNEHSIRNGHAPASRKGEGVLQYLSEAAENLARGGVVLLAPQAGREPSLHPIRTRTVEFFSKQMQRRHVANIGYLLVGLGIVGETDYAAQRVRGHNLGKTFAVKIGETYLQNELVELSATEDLTVDQWVCKQFEPLVPTAYLGQ